MTNTDIKTGQALLNQKQSLEMLRHMLRIRRFEEKSAELYSAMKIRGFLHLYIGEEAVAVGMAEALTVDDAVVATYREHGHAMVRGMSMGAIMAEMYGKVDGCCRGRGGFHASVRCRATSLWWQCHRWWWFADCCRPGSG